MRGRAEDDSARVRQGGHARPRSLPLAQWPDADRAAWQAACAPGARLRGGGAAAHLAQVTRDDLQRRYGYFLDHVVRAGLLDLTAIAAGQVTPERVDGFVAELSGRVSSVTLAQTVYKLRRMVSILAPGRDFEWVREMERDLAYNAVPKLRAGQLVDGPRLLQAGLTFGQGGRGCRESLAAQARLAGAQRTHDCGAWPRPHPAEELRRA